MQEQYDVVIIGGGPAGAAAAITLCRYTRLKVAIIERATFDDYRAGESVSPSIFPLLSYLGISRELVDNTHLPSYAYAAAWGSEELIVRDLLFSGQGNGMHLDRQSFDSQLISEAGKLGAAIFQPAQITEVVDGASWQIKIIVGGNDITLLAKYIIDCSGKNALIVKRQQSKVHKEDNLIALYAYYTANEGQIIPHQTMLETTEHGWYYLTPLPARKVAIAFITDADILKAIGISDLTMWRNAAMKTKHISGIISGLQEPDAFRHYAIHSRVALLPGDANWIAAGDAASCFDPISAMGIGHALSSGINSARVAQSFLNGDTETGIAYSRALLNHFETYLQMRHGFYTAERRWMNAPFWQRRAKSSLL